jgi:hypothetical protein
MQVAAPTTFAPFAPAASPRRDDSVFVTQFRSPLLPDGLAWGPDNGKCGPTTIVNARRLVGLDVPGFHGERTQAVIDAARLMATGENDSTKATTKDQQALALRAAGAHVEVTRSLSEGLRAVREGAVLVIGGNRAADGWPRRPDDAPPAGVASHGAVISRWVPETNRYVVFDPALFGPVHVDARQLAAFTQVVDGEQMLRLGLVVTNPNA